MPAIYIVEVLDKNDNCFYYLRYSDEWNTNYANILPFPNRIFGLEIDGIEMFDNIEAETNKLYLPQGNNQWGCRNFYDLKQLLIDVSYKICIERLKIMHNSVRTVCEKLEQINTGHIEIKKIIADLPQDN